MLGAADNGAGIGDERRRRSLAPAGRSRQYTARFVRDGNRLANFAVLAHQEKWCGYQGDGREDWHQDQVASAETNESHK